MPIAFYPKRFLIYHTPFIIHCLSYTVYHTPFIIHRLSYTAYHTPFIIHHLSYTVYHTPFIIHHLSYTVYHTPFIIHRLSYTIYHTPFIIHRLSYTIYHTPFIVSADSSAARLLGFRVQIPPASWNHVCCECCMLSDRGLCDEPITRPEECYCMWCVWECSRNLVEEAYVR